MTLEEELRAIWSRYEPQREAERNAVRVRQDADAELRGLNERRRLAGLAMVGEYQPPPSLTSAGNYVWTPPAKTWRDELDAELLSAVKRWLQ